MDDNAVILTMADHAQFPRASESVTINAGESLSLRRLPIPNHARRIRACTLPILLACATLPISPAASAQQTKFQIDPAQSTVHFSLGDTLHQFGGTFQIASSDIAFDPSTHEIRGEIVVDPNTGDSGSTARDKRMKNEELRSKDFPTITFQPKSYTGDLASSGSSQIQVSGIFTLIGQPHSITVPMTVQRSGNRCTATGQFDVPYIAWGLKDPSMFLVKMQKQVRIDLSLTGQIVPQ